MDKVNKTNYMTIEIDAKLYEDYDDCFEAAVQDYYDAHPELDGYDLEPRWDNDDYRDAIILTVPIIEDEE